MLKVNPKTANLATLQNFDVIENNGCRFRNQRPEMNLTSFRQSILLLLISVVKTPQYYLQWLKYLSMAFLNTV